MKKLSLLFAIFALLVLSQSASASIFLAGDSTCSLHSETSRPETGWGEKLYEYLQPRVKVVNMAKSGRSTKSYISEGVWELLVSRIKEQDIVLIQFGHNDERTKDPDRGTEPFVEYYDNLCRMVSDVRAKGAVPILLTPICRRIYQEDGTVKHSHKDYPKAMRKVARDTRTYLLDMESVTYDWLMNMDEESSRAYYMWREDKPDNMNLNDKGADVVAGMVAGELYKLGDENIRKILLVETYSKSNHPAPVLKGNLKKASQLQEARKIAAHKTRRVIMNNDGNDERWDNTRARITTDAFLGKRTLGLENSHVDAIFYCDGVTFVTSHHSKVMEHEHRMMKKEVEEYMDKLGTDPLQLIIDFCRENNKEIFWSMRINDNHDSTRDSLVCDFKKNHPELLVGQYQVDMPKMHNKWSCFDFNHKEVRDKTVECAIETLNNYDVDGIELDFFRHPAFFKEQFYKQPITEEHCAKMTDMVRQIRKALDKASLKRGRALLLAIRVPDSPAYSKAIGVDWIQWLEEGLIDIVTGADYIKCEPWANLAKIGEKYDVPVYACLEQRRLNTMIEEQNPDNETKHKLWIDEALCAWESGMSGIYTFNKFSPKDPVFFQIGDPEVLRKLGAEPRESYCGQRGYNNPNFWIDNGSTFIKKQ